MSDLFKERVFNSIEEINQRFGVELELPERIPEGCNLLCYKIWNLLDLELLLFYKDEEKLYAYSREDGWEVYNCDLETEIKEDISSKINYIYLRLNKEETEKEVFKLERLLGVETTEGFINKLNPNIRWFVNIGYNTCDPRELQYYISDDSDETVSFEEYLDMFYSRG